MFIFIFLACAIIIIVVIYALWRYWEDLVQVSPEEEAYDKDVAQLNERQANRMSDERLARVTSEDEAWDVMVKRGMRLAKSRDQSTEKEQSPIRDRPRTSRENVQNRQRLRERPQAQQQSHETRRMPRRW
ncbi:MAG: hypothetical protein AAGF95_05270 [Chloroflexota bacterium]